MRAKYGFTLVEILVVSTIIMILAGIGLVSYSALSRQSRNSRRIADLQNLRSALEFYRSDNDTYPLTANLEDLVRQDYLNLLPIDPQSEEIYPYCSDDGSQYSLCTNLEGVESTVACCNSNYNYKLTPLGEVK